MAGFPQMPPERVPESELASLFSGENAGYVEGLYEDYLLGRAEVPDTWAQVFDRLDGRRPASPEARSAAPVSPEPRPGETVPAIGIFALVNAYRTHGHLIGNLDPLGRSNREHPFLDPAEFGLGEHHMSQRVGCGSFLGCGEATPADLIRRLRETYCGTLGLEFMHIRDKERRDWLLERTEPTSNQPQLPKDERIGILTQLLAAERLEQMLHRRFLGQKRFSLEGGDALIPLLDAVVQLAADLGGREIVLGMAHRGRLNVMAHILGMPYRAILREFQPTLMPADAQGVGDVKYHRGYSAHRASGSGREFSITLCANPSHLEWVNPIAEGMVRAKQNYRGDRDRTEVIPVLIHGDAAFNGQGIVPETLSLSELEDYWTGGTIHIIVNNQIGFTTNPEQYRFTRYPSDAAKIIDAPVFHLNADDPEACVHAARLATAFRQQFKEDVIIDLICYRRYGHNEGDDPSLTQPSLYKKIAEHPTVGKLYTEKLLEEGAIDRASVEQIEEEQRRVLEHAFEESRSHLWLEGAEGYRGLWEGLRVGNENPDRPTAVPRGVIDQIAEALVRFPPGFKPHPKVKRLLEERSHSLAPGGKVDWGGAEAAAVGSLLLDGKIVRMTGQDTERGTFSQRHAVVHDVETEQRYVPLNELGGEKARFLIANSMLSEAAVLGFEYGYSTVDPHRLAIWEAQYGDFSNCAQVIIDQFIASAEKKWDRASGIVLLLPHGYEGQGPEHSSARLERFLQLCAEDNMQVCNLTTPAQYFHVLRRQLCRSYRKPLVLMTPKSLLRYRAAASPVEELETGSFQPVLDDPAQIEGALDAGSTRRVLICSGKVFYTLLETREEGAFNDVAILRLEEIHPFPYEEIRRLLSPYSARDVVWVQEEPWNMGAWSFVRERLESSLPEGATLRYVGRPESASPATGSFRIHQEEEAEFVQDAFALRARPRRTSERAG